MRARDVGIFFEHIDLMDLYIEIEYFLNKPNGFFYTLKNNPKLSIYYLIQKYKNKIW